RSRVRRPAVGAGARPSFVNRVRTKASIGLVAEPVGSVGHLPLLTGSNGQRGVCVCGASASARSARRDPKARPQRRTCRSLPAITIILISEETASTPIPEKKLGRQGQCHRGKHCNLPGQTGASKSGKSRI